MSMIFVPETLTWCRQHYVPNVDRYITCEDFGHTDGMNGACWWCMEMTPYQWHMCCDETWLRHLMKSCGNVPARSKEEAIQFIEEYKQKHPMGNEQKAFLSEKDE